LRKRYSALQRRVKAAVHRTNGDEVLALMKNGRPSPRHSPAKKSPTAGKVFFSTQEEPSPTVPSENGSPPTVSTPPQLQPTASCMHANGVLAVGAVPQASAGFRKGRTDLNNDASHNTHLKPAGGRAIWQATAAATAASTSTLSSRKMPAPEPRPTFAFPSTSALSAGVGPHSALSHRPPASALRRLTHHPLLGKQHDENSRASFEKLAQGTDDLSNMSETQRMLKRDETENMVASTIITQLAKSPKKCGTPKSISATRDSESTPDSFANVNMDEPASGMSVLNSPTSGSATRDSDSTPDSFAHINMDEPASGLSVLNSARSATLEDTGKAFSSQRQRPKGTISFLTGVLQRSKSGSAFAKNSINAKKRKKEATMGPPLEPPPQRREHSAPNNMQNGHTENSASKTPARRPSCPVPGRSGSSTGSTPLNFSNAFPSSLSVEVSAAGGATVGNFTIAGSSHLGGPAVYHHGATSDYTSLLEGSTLGRVFDATVSGNGQSGTPSPSQLATSNSFRTASNIDLDIAAALNSLSQSPPDLLNSSNDAHNKSTSLFAKVVGEKAVPPKKRKLQF